MTLQGTVAVESITIKNTDRSLKISYLDSNFKTYGYAYPQIGLIKDYGSFAKNLNRNKNLFISLAGYTKFGAPLSLVYKDGKPYVKVVNTTTLEESDILIPQDVEFIYNMSELRSE